MIKLLRSFRSVGLFISCTLLAAFWLTTGCGLFHGGKDETIEFSDVPTTPGSVVGSTSSTGSSGTVLTLEDTARNRFGIDDLVIVTFSGLGSGAGTDPNPPRHEERVKDDGTITLPLIGAVKAKDRTPGELQNEIRLLYVPRYYNSNLNVTVTGDQRYFYVQGRVRTPNRFAYAGEITVTKAIAAAGDFDDFADRKKVILTRANGKTYTVNCVKALRDPSLDLKVYPGDKIVVPQRYF